MNIIFKFLMSAFILPVLIAVLFVRRVIESRCILGRESDNVTKQVVEEKVEAFIEIQLNSKEASISETLPKSEVEFCRLIYHYVIEKSLVHFGQLQNYVALFGFTRTLSFTGCALFWVLIIRMSIAGFNTHVLYYTISLFAGLGVLYLAFNKLYCKYSLEALMAFVILYEYPALKKKQSYREEDRQYSCHISKCHCLSWVFYM